MANNDMNIAMKFTADVNRAKENISQLNAELKDSANVAQDANQKSAKSYQDVLKAQTEAMDRGQRYEVELQKQAKAQEAATKAAETHKKEVEKLRNGLDKLLASIDPATKGLGRLDELESKLRQSKKAGVIDGDTFDDYLGKISNQRAALSTVDSLSEGTKKLSLNTKTSRREMKTFITQLARGDLSGAGNSLLNLGNSTGRLPALFNAATLSVGAFIAAAYGIYKVVSSLQEEQNRFNKALISTGNYTGATSSHLGEMSNRIGKINSNYSETSKVISGLVSTGDLSARSIENIATASAHLIALTGQSAEEAIASFDGIKNSVTNWALETTRQYNWLDLATYQRIAALEAQSETEEAIAVATGKFADVMEQRVNDMQNQLVGLEKAWSKFKDGVSDFGQYLKRDLKVNMGMGTLDEKIAKLQGSKTNNSKITPDGFAVPWTSFDEEELQGLIEQKKLLEEKVQAESKIEKINKEAVNAQKELNELWKNNRSEAEKQTEVVDELRKKYQAIWADGKGRQDLEAKGVTSTDGQTFSGGQYDKDVKEITDKGLKEYNKSVEKTLKLTTELSKVMYEINEGQYKNATQAEKDRAIALAKQIDAKNAEKKNSGAGKQTLSNDKTNLGLQQQLNQLLSGTKASDETVDQWYNNLLTQFKKSGNKQGIDLIDQLLPLKKAEANLNEITTKIQQAQSHQSTKEQSIQAQVTSGLITQIEAQSQLVELHKQTADELAQYLPILESMTTLPGQAGENAQKALATLQLQVAELRKTTDALTNAFKNGLQNGIQSSLEGLAKGTFNLSEALTNLGQSVLSSMAQVATQGLADMAMTGLNNLFGFSADSSQSSNTGTEIKASLTEGSATLTTALDTSFANGAMMLSTAVAGQSQLGTTTPIQTAGAAISPTATIATNTTDAASAQMGNSITSAASSGAATIGTAIVSSAASGSNVLSSALNAVFSTAISGIISAMASNTAASGFSATAAVAVATGGYISGAGTSTSDSIPARLSNGEYVVKAAAVKKYGVDYLHAINTGRLHHYSSGGLVSNVNTPKAPEVSQNESSDLQQSQSTPVIQQTLVFDSAEAMQSGFKSVGGQRAAMTWIRSNSSTLRQVLGVK